MGVSRKETLNKFSQIDLLVSVALLGAMALFSAPCLAGDGTPDLPEIQENLVPFQIKPATGPIRIDGHVDDAAWLDALKFEFHKPSPKSWGDCENERIYLIKQFGKN